MDERIDKIIRIYKFFGKYDKKQRERIAQITSDEMDDELFMTEFMLGSLKNPEYRLYRLISYWVDVDRHCYFDYRWNKFINFINSLNKGNRLGGAKYILSIFVRHCAADKVMINLLSTLFYYTYFEKMADVVEVMGKLESYFSVADCVYLLDKKPMSYTYWERYSLLVILQVARNDGMSVDLLKNLRSNYLSREGTEERVSEAIKPNRYILKIFPYRMPGFSYFFDWGYKGVFVFLFYLTIRKDYRVNRYNELSIRSYSEWLIPTLTTLSSADE